MTEILAVLLSITALFALLLTGKTLFKKKICPLCLGVSLTWIALLGVRALGYNPSQTIIAVLVGESVVGVYHLVEKRSKEDWGVFRLPFLLTLTFAAYLLLGADEKPLPSLAYLVILWTVLAAAYAMRKNPIGRETIKKLIACCRDW